MAVVTAFDIFGRGLNMADVALTQWMLDGPATPPANLAQGVGVGVNVTVGIGLDARFQMNVDAAPISRFRFTVTTDADGNWTIIRFESTDVGRAQLVTLEGIALATEKGQLSASVLMADFLTGNDTITGNRFSDVLRGSEGNDILFGGLESVQEHIQRRQRRRSIMRTDAQRRNASAFWLRHSQSLLKRLHLFNQAMVRSTIQRLGNTTNLPLSQRRTISTFTARQTRARPVLNFGPWYPASA